MLYRHLVILIAFLFMVHSLPLSCCDTSGCYNNYHCWWTPHCRKKCCQEGEITCESKLGDEDIGKSREIKKFRGRCCDLSGCYKNYHCWWTPQCKKNCCQDGEITCESTCDNNKLETIEKLQSKLNELQLKQVKLIEEKTETK